MQNIRRHIVSLTVHLNAEEVKQKIAQAVPGEITIQGENTMVVGSDILYRTAEHLKNAQDMRFDYLASLTAVDYLDRFELVYHLVSLEHNHSLVLKTHLYDRQNPVIDSVYDLWRAADYQERELYDLMGITFTGHPNLKRLFLWEGFPGHPLRRDYL